MGKEISMKTKKIGIVTHYYGSVNYGGCLQAYALTHVLREMGYDASQISYNFRTKGPMPACSFKGRVRRIIERIFYSARFEQRYRALEAFRDATPHSERVYDGSSIGDTTDLYDVFITGSDQVWNTSWYHSAFFLDFVGGGKTKLSYAASLGRPTLSEAEREKMRESLKDYTAISVREQDAVALLSDLTEKKVEWTLDPTLLLSRDDWEKVSSGRKMKGKYLFCYFLSTDKRTRRLATEYAREKGLTVVTLPHFPSTFSKNDFMFGDVHLYDVTPNDFISLIKNAECVFTDSFHAAVFSNLYKKEFFVFDRLHASEMKTRILTLLPLFGTEARFCREEDFTLSHLLSVGEIEYGQDSEYFDSLVKRSRDFLKNAIENGAVNE